MFIDEVILKVEGGAGGNGKVSYFPMRGGPSGGSGGNGGSVYAMANPQMSSLSSYSSRPHIKAEDGIHGDKNRKFGANAEDYILQVPVGSTLIDLDTKEQIELNKAGEKVLIVTGGEGGRGNDALKTASNQTPKKAELGKQGEIRNIKIVQRLIADYGLIGIPNAGKSTLLNILTAANVRTADYPFTTLEPALGMLDKKILADIPGLIEGASKGKGLGIKFLKHIEKVSLLLHCISAESTDVKRDYETIRKELVSYSPELGKKDEIILLTKSDLIEEKEIKKKIKELKKITDKVYPISVIDDKSIEVLKKILNA